MNITQTHTEIHNTAKIRRTISTLLIPSIYLEQYYEKCRLHGSRASYFNYLLIYFGSQIKQFEGRLIKQKDSKWKTCYQNQGLNLEKKNFRPEPELWEQLRLSADSFGVSMCYLFIFMMELEMWGLCHPILEVEEPGNPDVVHKSKIWKNEMRDQIDKNRWSSNKYQHQNKKISFFCSRQVVFLPKSLKRTLVFTVS